MSHGIAWANVDGMNILSKMGVYARVACNTFGMSERSVSSQVSRGYPEPYVLAVDIGSSSARAALFDAEAKRLPNSFQQIGYDLSTDADGRAELDPLELFDIVVELIDGALSSFRDIRVAAAGVSGFWHSLMGVDERGSPTSRVLTWADTRSGSAAQAIRRSIDERAYHQRSGTRVHSSYPLAKLAFIRTQRPEIWQRTVRWVSFHEYMLNRLLGEWRCSISMASATGLINRRDLVWDRDALDIAGIDESRLSPISDEPLSGLQDDFAEQWPQLASIPWFPAVGDGAANSLGAGATGPERPALMIGTTGAMRVMMSTIPESIPDALWQYRLRADTPLVGGALSEGGNVYDWLRRNLNMYTDNESGEPVFRAGPDGHGLTWLPFLAGERSPGWSADASGALIGLRIGTDPADIIQAAFEGIGYRFAQLHRNMDGFVAPDATFIATGNGLRRNPVWIQILADILGRPIILPPRTEASLRGAAIHVLGCLPAPVGPGSEAALATLAADIQQGQRFEPNPACREIYDRAIARQQALYRNVILNPLDD